MEEQEDKKGAFEQIDSKGRTFAEAMQNAVKAFADPNFKPTKIRKKKSWCDKEVKRVLAAISNAKAEIICEKSQK